MLLLMSISLCLLYSFFDNSLLKNVIFPYLSSDLTSVLLVSKEAAELFNKQCQISEHRFRSKCKYNHEQEHMLDIDSMANSLPRKRPQNSSPIMLIRSTPYFILLNGWLILIIIMNPTTARSIVPAVAMSSLGRLKTCPQITSVRPTTHP